MRYERDYRFRNRIITILLLGLGWEAELIAQFMFMDVSTVYRWKDNYLEGVIELFLQCNHKGKACKLNETQQKELEEYLKQLQPISLEQVLRYISEKFRIKYSKPAIVRLEIFRVYKQKLFAMWNALLYNGLIG